MEIITADIDVDTASYARHTTPVVADLDGLADDGASGEGESPRWTRAWIRRRPAGRP